MTVSPADPIISAAAEASPILNMTQCRDRPEGVVNLYKPPGTSSARFVYRLRPVFGIRKVGHAGTLDPFADGVLIACIGRATRLVERLMALSKCYRTTLRLGVTNRTLDTEQPFDPVPGAKPVALKQIEGALTALVGTIDQVPPVYSAVKVGGVSSHRLVRGGRPPTLKARKVRVDRIDVLDYDWPRLRLEIRCGRGTYIRAIARDLGAALGCGACCEQLTRTAVGPFHVEDAARLDDPEALRAALLPIAEVLRRIDPPARPEPRP